LKANFTWSKRGLDGDYFTQNPIRPLTGKAGDYPHLNHLLDMWHFKTKADRTNAVAMFLDRIFTGVSNFNGKHLVTIVSGNQQGVGKTELANCVLYLAQGETTTVLMENEVRKADFERQILPKIKDIPVSAILVDNVTGGAGGVFDSSNLVSMMTGQRLALRIFHSQRLFNLPNNFQWVITTNGANYSDDLIERSILVEIYHPGKPKYDQTTPLEYVIAHSEELHAEIKAMYDYWVSQGEPKFELIRRNREYFTILNSVLASNGFGGFDSNREILSQSSADPDTEIIAEIFAVWQDNPSSFKTSEIMGRLSPQTQEHACGNGADKSQQTKLGKKLAGLAGRDFQQEGKVFRFESRSVNNGYQFFFKKVPEDRAPEVAVEETKQITEKALPVAGNGANPICPEAVEESYNLGGDLNGIFD
jgi:hypothetical protein